MTTKEQERKALEQIKNIVEVLGPDSYIAAAFDGAWEIAESNIANDFGDSVRGSIAFWKFKTEEIEKENRGIKSKLKTAEDKQSDLARRLEIAEDRVSSKQEEIGDVRGRLVIAAEAARKAEEKAVVLYGEMEDMAKQHEMEMAGVRGKAEEEVKRIKCEADAKIKAQEMEIVNLKAKLFDLLYNN